MSTKESDISTGGGVSEDSGMTFALYVVLPSSEVLAPGIVALDKRANSVESVVTEPSTLHPYRSRLLREFSVLPLFALTEVSPSRFNARR